MGARPYWYFVPYDSSTQRALDGLRAKEFEAGRYSPVCRFLEFEEPAFSATHPGPRHATIADALKDAAEEGTRSILDVSRVGKEAEPGVAAAMSEKQVLSLFDTDKPTRDIVKRNLAALFGGLERGECVYLVVYKDAKPAELFFAGYSYD